MITDYKQRFVILVNVWKKVRDVVRGVAEAQMLIPGSFGLAFVFGVLSGTRCKVGKTI